LDVLTCFFKIKRQQNSALREEEEEKSEMMEKLDCEIAILVSEIIRSTMESLLA